ncbi:MAG: hypothetical protein ABFD16_14165 [Thermoguttaceae bacterium]|jgi:predicted membrane channel-forming protein YqfA (hemolysin III family)
MQSEHQVPIWFFIGALLLVYGIVIFSSGLYLYFVPPEHKVQLFEYHADIWWGILLTVLGAIYCRKFHPWRKPEPELPTK